MVKKGRGWDRCLNRRLDSPVDECLVHVVDVQEQILACVVRPAGGREGSKVVEPRCKAKGRTSVTSVWFRRCGCRNVRLTLR